MVDLPITQQVFWKVGLANLGKFAPVDEDGENDECLHQNCKCRRLEMGDTQLFNRAASTQISEGAIEQLTDCKL